MSSVAHMTIEVDDEGAVEFILKTDGDNLATQILANIMDYVEYSQRHNASKPYEMHGVQ